MPNVNCAFIGCSNSTYRLNKWKKSVCEHHAPATKNDCVCAAPFKLFCFPSTLRNSRDRSKWVKLLRREIPGKKKKQKSKYNLGELKKNFTFRKFLAGMSSGPRLPKNLGE